MSKKATSLLLTLSLLFTALPLIYSTPLSNLRVLDDSPGCWVVAYGRGVGKPITVCPDGLVESGYICYPPCQSDFTGKGPVCWQNCPSGWKDSGADCLKPESYWRSGYVSWHESECNDDNPQGCEGYGGMWYPKCKENFHAVGCCVCSPDCPNSMPDVGVSCEKQKHGRGVGVPLVCTKDQDQNAGLCYPFCRSGYKGVGPVCWGQCASGLYQCGALCVKDEGTCTSDILSIAEKVFKFLIALAEDGETGDIYDIVKSGVNLGSAFSQFKMCDAP